MAISDVEAYAHLTTEDVEKIGEEFEAIRREVMDSLGERDRRYVQNTIRLQRGLVAGGRVVLLFSGYRPAWVLGTGLLAAGKIIENMELGHNVMHGQWDWMNDPVIHSTTWEWDIVGTSEHWKATHNHHHHTYTNIIGMDDDVGYGVVRVTRDQPWHPAHAGNIVWNGLLALLFQWGVGVQHLEIAPGTINASGWPEQKKRIGQFLRKARRQVGKDYVWFPLLSGPNWKTTMTANATANVIRNLWSNAVIFCGHFPDGADKFTLDDLENETQAQWYLRQMLGSANFTGSQLMHFMSGNLSYQIEHHLFPTMPSNRYGRVAEQVQDLCRRWDLPYTSGPLYKQYWQSWRTIAKLTLPDRFLTATSDDAPETRSEKMFEGAPRTYDDHTGPRSGLATALRHHRRRPARQR
ncbi:MAG TPA: fatty acid desaturase [Candidatus Dietzia intestinipullorum]|nr:fatty acid desaturase [Candidatus Dietzia intestinipullorum]